MKNVNDIDRIFRDALYNREEAYDASDWKEMEKILNEHDRPAPSGFPWKYTLPALLALITSAFIWMWPDSSADQIKSNAPLAEVVSTTSEVPAVVEEPSTMEETHTPIVVKAIQKPSMPAPAVKANAISEPIAVHITPVNSNAAMDEKETTRVTAGTSDEEPSGYDQNVVAVKAEKPQSSLNTEAASQTGLPDLSLSEEVLTEPETAKTMTEQPTSDLRTVSENPTSGSSGGLPETAYTPEESEQTESTPAVPESITASLEENPEEVAKKLPEKVTDETDIEMVPDPDKKLPSSTGLTGWRVIGTAGYTTSSASENGNQTSPLAYGLGLGYEKRLHPHFSVEARFMLTRRNAGGLTYNVRQELYDFGVQTNNFQYQYSAMNMLEIPVFMNYLFLSKHQLGIGAQYSRLLSTSYDYSITGVNEMGETREFSGQGTQVKGVFNANDVALFLGYQYLWTDRIKVGLNAQFGTMNLVNQDLMPDNRLINHQIRLQVTYKFME